jgi:hypothetical protein
MPRKSALRFDKNTIETSRRIHLAKLDCARLSLDGAAMSHTQLSGAVSPSQAGSDPTASNELEVFISLLGQNV